MLSGGADTGIPRRQVQSTKSWIRKDLDCSSINQNSNQINQMIVHPLKFP